jgi:hypothetical protein
MKYLRVSSPLILWILNYFLWKHADAVGAFSQDPINAVSTWWVLTVIFGGLALIPAAIVAIGTALDDF